MKSKQQRAMKQKCCGTYKWRKLFSRVKTIELKLTTSVMICIIHDLKRTAKAVLRGQADKSARGMPWHQEPMKDVTSCDKLRGAAHTH